MRMKDELLGLLRRQTEAVRIFKAYDLRALAREAVLFPLDILSGSGRSSSVLNLAVFVTHRCNARCAMCNIAGVLNKRGPADLPLDRFERLLDEVRAMRPSIILFGGEPFIRTDLPEFVAAVKRRGLTVGTFTNGLSIDETAARRIVEEGIDYVAFSVQGPRSVHDAVLGVPGAFDRMVRAIGLVASRPGRKTKVVTHTTICEGNIRHLEDVARLCLDSGADLVRFGHPTFFAPAEAASCRAALERSLPEGSGADVMGQIYEVAGKEELFFTRIMSLRNRFGRKISFTPDLGPAEIKAWYSPRFSTGRRCFFAWRGAFIHANGNLYPCESICRKMGNVFEEGFAKVWNGPRYRAFRLALKKGLFPACARCCKL